MSRGKLTALQDHVLDAFFAKEQRFVLTGGAALAGFYTKHRVTKDLDVFTQDAAAMPDAIRALEAISLERSLLREVKADSPTFHREVVGTADEMLVIDVVHDLSPQLGAPATVVDRVRLDAIEQIFVNKLTTLVGRKEERDLIDVMVLERSGLRAEDFMKRAYEKDGGCTPATMAWLLEPWTSELTDDLILPGGVRGAEVKAFMSGLTARMKRLAFPATPTP